MERTRTNLMPHPELACEPLLGSDDGKWIFESIFAALKKKTVAAAAPKCIVCYRLFCFFYRKSAKYDD